ncbi:MAG: hypothetical protein B7Z10_02070, partial [Rhodobacterales bacterium 32-66-7]
MLDTLDAVYLLARPNLWTVVFGALPDAAQRAELEKTAQARPSARKLGEGMVISVPLSADRWLFWQLSAVPPVSELASVMARLQDLSRGLERLVPGDASDRRPVQTEAGAKPAVSSAELILRLKTALGGRARPKPATVMTSLLDLLVETGAIDGGMLIDFAATAARRHWLSDSRYRSHAAEIRLVAESLRTAEARSLVVPATGERAEHLEAALLARQFGSAAMAFVLPPKGMHGLGFCGFGPDAVDLALLSAALDLAAVVAPPKAPGSERRRWIRRGLLWGGAALAAVWLALPTPIAVTATGEATAQDLTVVAMPGDAYLKAMHVRPGDRVEKGDVLADFDSPALRDMLAEEELNATIETLGAQAALAENRYSDYQIATERLKIVTTRIDQINARIAALQIKATADGRIIEAIPDSVTGAFVRTGDQVAAIQTSTAMRIKLTFARLDARLVTPGMTGTAY